MAYFSSLNSIPVFGNSFYLPKFLVRTFNFSKWFIVSMIILMGVGSVSGATFTATQSGNWSSTATWGGAGTPTSTDNVAINYGITVTLTANVSCNTITLNQLATLALGGFNFSSTSTIFNSDRQTISGTGNGNTLNLGGNATLIFNNANINTTGYNVTIAGSPTVTNGAYFNIGASNLNIGGNLAVNTSAYVLATGTNSIIGGNLDISNNANVSVGVGNLSIAGNLTISTSAYLIANGNNEIIGGNLDISNGSYVSIGTGNLTITGNYTNISNSYNTKIDWSTGTVTIDGNIVVGKNGQEPFTCTGTGWLYMNSSSKTVTLSNDITIPRFRQTSSGFLKTGGNTLTISTVFDQNCGPAAPAGVTISVPANTLTCPSLSATALTSFGNVCTGSSAGPYSFTITGIALLASPNVTLATLPGFTYSNTSGGTYTSTLSLTQSGGPYSQVIYVMFNPSTVTTYSGNIVVGGGGAPNINVPAVGSGASSVTPTITSPTFATILSTSATLGGTITIAGCSSQSITERGIYYSTTSGFADGTGTKVSETGTFGAGTFTENVTGLSLSTTYYYKAFATNNSGTVYTAQSTFNNIPKTYYTRQSGNWTSPSTWSTVSCGNTTNTGTYPGPIDNVDICNNNNTNTVTLDANVNCNSITLDQKTTLLLGGYNFSSNSTTFNSDQQTISGTGNGNNTLSLGGNSTLIFNAKILTTGYNITIGGNLNISNGAYVSLGAGNLSINGDFTNTLEAYNTKIDWTDGTVTIGGNITVGKKNYEPFNCSGAGWLIMNGSSKVFSVNNLANYDITVPRFRIGSSSITKAGPSKLTISSSFDLNNQSSFTQSAGSIDVTGTVANYSSMAMAYSGTPTFSYSGGGKIVGGRYYNLTTQTTDISIDCGTTVTCAGIFTNSRAITGPTTTGYYARVVNTNPVTNSGTIGASLSYIAFSGTISGGTVGTNVKTSSTQVADCNTVFYSIASGNWTNNIWSYTSGGPATGVYPLGGDVVYIENGYAVIVNLSNAACNQLTISNGSNNTTSSLTINTNAKLSIAGAFAFNGSNGQRKAALVNNGTIEFGSTVSFGNSNTSYTIGSNSTFVYNGNTNQTVQTIPGNSYYNLTLSGSGVKSLQTSITTIGGNLIFSGNATTTSITDLTIGGNVILGSGTTFSGATFTHNIAGNWTNNGGNFTPGTGTITFNGNAPQYIGGSASSTFNNLTIANTAAVGNNTITLGMPVTVSGTLTMTSGILSTSSTNLLSVANPAATAITGGSASTFINGPVSWSLPSSFVTARSYNFPVGKGSTYLPVVLVNPTTGTGAVTARIEAFANDPGGSVDASLGSISNTEYWSLIPTGNFTSGSVTLTRPTAIAPFNAIGGSTSVTGIYSLLNGAIGTYSIAGSDAIGSNRVFALAVKPPVSACAYSNNPSGIATVTPVVNMPSNVQQVSASYTNGTYFVMNVIKGLTYQVYTSGTPGAALKMSIYKEGDASGSAIAASNSNSGNPYNSVANNVYLPFTSPVSGQVRIQINSRSDCSTGAITGIAVSLNIISGNNTQDDSNAAGTDKWIGHIYDGTSFNNYLGYYYVGAETFQEAFGTGGTWPGNIADDVSGFNILSNDITRAQVKEVSFSAHYRMNSTKRGFYSFDVTSDDGAQLFVDGYSVYNHWDDHAFTTNTNMLLSLTGNSSLVLDYYENAGSNIIGFNNLTQIFSNTLSSNLTQVISKNTTGALIGGDAFGAFPTGITGQGYQWYYSTPNDQTRRIITGATSFTFTPNASSVPFNNIVGIYYLYRDATLRSSNNFNPALYDATNESNVATVRIKANPNYWVGNSDTNWQTATNWSDGVPYPGDNVEFATTANGANGGSDAGNNIELDNDYVVGNFTNQSGKQLIISPATSLIVNGTITTNNNFQIYIQSSQNLANGTLIFPNATNVYGTVEMYSKAFCNNKSTSPHSEYKWQYFGIPVEAIPANPIFYGSYIRSWDESKDAVNHWRMLSNDSIVKPFYGYEITQEDAKTIIFSGKLINRDFYSGKLAISPAPAAFPGQHIFANPYTAAINIKYLNFGLDADSTVYLYNTGSLADWVPYQGSNTLSGYQGQYTAIPQNTAGNLMQGDVPSMQAMLIRPNLKHTTFDNFTFGITYNSVIIKNASLQKSPSEKTESSTDKIAGTFIDLKGKNYSDRIWLFTQPGCTRNFDNGWDGAKIMGSALTPQIFAIEPDGNYQVNTVDDLNNTELGFQAGGDVEYTLTFTHQNLKNDYSAMFLYDIVENKTVDITESGATYSFTAESTPTAQKRFIIATRNIKTDLKDTETQLKIFNSENIVFVDNLSSLPGDIAIYDMTGRMLKTAKFGPLGVTAFNIGNISGAYIVNAVTGNERISKRIILGK